MKSEYRKVASRVCVFDAADLGRLFKAATSGMSTVKITIKCSDGVILTTDSCDELLDFKNPESQSIIGLEVGATGGDGNMVLFEINQKIPSNCRLSVSGDGSFASRAFREIQDILDHARPWYGKALEIPWPIILINGVLSAIFLIPASVFLLIRLGFLSGELNLLAGKKNDLSPILFGMTVGAAPFLWTWFYRVFLNRFFPVLFFEIGDGVKRYKKIVIVRGFVAAVLSSIIASALYALLHGQ